MVSSLSRRRNTIHLADFTAWLCVLRSGAIPAKRLMKDSIKLMDDSLKNDATECEISSIPISAV